MYVLFKSKISTHFCYSKTKRKVLNIATMVHCSWLQDLKAFSCILAYLTVTLIVWKLRIFVQYSILLLFWVQQKQKNIIKNTTVIMVEEWITKQNVVEVECVFCCAQMCKIQSSGKCNSIFLMLIWGHQLII